jgi:uncharacterized protein (TIGR02147 family)
MESLYFYSDYRHYLRDFFSEKKRKNRKYSYKVLADKAGFKARDYILRVMTGKRNLSHSGIFRLAHALGLSQKETDYFSDLVAFNQAATPAEKELFFGRMTAGCPHGKHQVLRKDQFEYFSAWYYGAIRSLLPVMDFGDDFAKLGKFLDPPLTPGEARRAVELLIRLGLIRRTGPGKYSVSASSLTAGDEVTSLALVQFHREALDLAKRAIERFPSQDRDVSGVTMSLSKKGYNQIKSEIQALRKKAMVIAEKDRMEDAAYQLNIQLFPLSKRRTV